MTESEQHARKMFDAMEIKDRSFLEFWASLYSEELKLFWVRNSSGYPRPFLAENEQLALYVAFTNGDLRNVRNGHATLVDSDYFAKNPAFASAVGKAIRDGRPGPVYQFDDGSIRVGDVVHKPLHAV